MIITLTDTQLKQLSSFIIENLKCACGFTYEESRNEPCLCSWTPIAEWFEDEADIEFKYHEEAMQEWDDDYWSFVKGLKDKDKYQDIVNKLNEKGE